MNTFNSVYIPHPQGKYILYSTYIIWPKANSKQMRVWPHTDLKVFICHTALLRRVILYCGFFRTEVSKLSPGGLVSCRVQLKPLSNTPETVNLSILEHFWQMFWGKLELNSAGHRPSRTEFGHPALEQITSSRMGTYLFILHVCCLLFVIFSIGSPESDCYTIIQILLLLHFSLCDFSEIDQINKIA